MAEVKNEKPGRKFREVTAEFVTFTVPGMSYEGTLLNKMTTLVGTPQKEVGKYTIVTDDGEPLAFLGGAILDEAFALIEVGQYVRVTYDREEMKAGGHRLKHFKVEVAE